MACCCNSGQSGENTSQMLVQVKRVFNGARLSGPVTDQVLILTNISPVPILPLTYVRTEGEGIATIISQTVTPMTNGRSRVVIHYAVGLNVNMRDAGGNLITAGTAMQRTLDVIMVLPTKPYSFEVAYMFSANIGTIEDETAIVTGCLLTVLKVLVKCEIVIKPCGCVTYPDAVETQEITCDAVFSSDI